MPPTDAGPAVLVVESRPSLRRTLAGLLRAEGWTIVEAGDAHGAMGLKAAGLSLIVVGELDTPSGALGLVGRLRASDASTPILLFPAHGSEDTAVAAMRLGVSDYVRQPAYGELVAAARAWLAGPGAARPVQRPQLATVEPPVARGEDALGALLGRDPAVVRVREYVAKLAPTDSNVLITGESGTGKELVAVAIHRRSRRRQAPFVVVNCAAIPEGLLESELFGFERGAFTGAHRRFVGRLEQAQHGTLFLDEVGELSAPAQAKLLRAIEQRQVGRLGGQADVRLDVRVVAATNQALEPMVAANRFRRDLYFRLAVTRVALPPLRERLADLPLLVAHFVGEVNRRCGRRLGAAAPETLEHLGRHTWPGNVRELKNLIEATAVEKEAGPIAVEDLPAWFVALRPETPSDERRCLLAALEQARGNKSVAALRLNWSRMTLYRKLARYGLADAVHQHAATARRAHASIAGGAGESLRSSDAVLEWPLSRPSHPRPA